MSVQQKAILLRLLQVLFKTSLWIVDVVLLVTTATLSLMIRSSTWLLGKSTQLKLKVKELYNDTGTTTSEKGSGKQH